LDHSKADSVCRDGLHAYEGGKCRDCGKLATQDAHCLACGFELVGGANVGLCPKCGSANWYLGRRRPVDPQPRTVKKFLVQFEGDAATRWLSNDEQIRRTLEALAKTTANSISGGSIPQTSVVIER